MMQGTEVQNKCAGNDFGRADQTCISRNQRDTLLDLVEYRLQTRFRRFLPKCQVHVLHKFVRIRIWDRKITSTEIRDGSEPFVPLLFL